MQPESDKALTRRELIQRSGMAAGALLLSPGTDTLAQNAPAGTPEGIPAEAPLPNGVKAVWDLRQAYAEKTPTRERVCLNGLWRWQPAPPSADAVPVGQWGYFKVPGSWPGITDYLQKDCQTVYPHPDWRNARLSEVTAAWYQREITVPEDWASRRIAFSAEYLNSLADVYIDGKKAGEIRFPGGEADITALCRPGAVHLLSVFVAALPLQAVMLSYTDTSAARQVKGTVERRGLCGDVTLVSVPQAARIADVKVDTSVRRGEITFDIALEGLAPGTPYALRAQVRGKGHTVREFAGPPFQASDLQGGRIAFTEKWRPEDLWDLNTPQNLYTAQVSLAAPDGRLLDAVQPVRFGFREFWIQGRDFYLNGSRIFLSAVTLDNAAVGAAWASYAGTRETLERLKSFGINFVYTHNYGCEPGTHLSFAEILRAADDAGIGFPPAAAQALIRNNRPLLAYIGGKPARFTIKDHNFLPGETVEKQLILINNSRSAVSCDCRWSFGLPQAVAAGSKKVHIPTGEQARIPLRFPLPPGLTAGRYELTATVLFGNGETQRDSFTVNVLPPPPALRTHPKIALFDPHGETARRLGALGVRFQSVDAAADLSPYEVLIIGKGALTRDGAGPDVRRVRAGLKVVMFEQTAEVLERRFGFRTAEYGLRQVFRRTADHPLLAGLEEENLCDWRGEATILPPRLKYVVGPRYAPQVTWCGIDETRVWRCGCRGNVASVLIEKPARGDFLPILDGGYSLQYSPLLEFREGKGMILFCQMDVTGRTESDPAADRLMRNILRYASAWKPSPRRKAFYVGEPAGRDHLKAAGFTLGDYAHGKLPADAVLIVGPGGGQQLASREPAVRDWLRAGGRLLAIGLDSAEANEFLPVKVQMKRAEHIAAYFNLPAADSWRAGIGPADVHNRDPRILPLVSEGAAVGDGVLARAENANIVFSQLVPWQFDPTRQRNLKRTFRRAAYLTTRLIANMGVPSSTPLLARFHSPADAAEKRWPAGLYLDTPEEWDDPYRFFGW